MVAQLLRGVCASKKQQLKKEAPEPTLMEGSILAETYLLDSLLKKVVKGTEIKSENNLSDMVHHLMIKNSVPTLGVDLDQIGKDIEIKFIVPKKGKKAQDLNFTPETRNIVLWLMNTDHNSPEEFEELVLEFSKTIQKYCNGLLDDIYYLTVENPETDLKYISERELHPEDFEEKDVKGSTTRKTGSITNKDGAMETSEKITPEKPPKNISPDQKSLLEPKEPKSFVFEPSIRDQLQQELEKAVQLTFAGNGKIGSQISELQIEIETPREAGHGDYASNIALKLAKIVGKNPREIAEQILKNMPVKTETEQNPVVTVDYLEKAEIAGAGFINFHLSQSHLKKELQKILDFQKDYGRIELGKGQKAVIDFSSPNVAKPLGVHHLLSTLIGQTVINILRFAGFEVIGVNYLGDWGTQFGKLIYAYKNWGDRAVIETDPLNELLKLYVRFHDEAEKYAHLEEKGREEFKKLEEGDSENRKIWEWVREISIKELERLYKKLGVHFDEYLPESMYEEGMKDILKEGKEKGIFVEGEKGAYIVQFDEPQAEKGENSEQASAAAPAPATAALPPYLVQKGDGTTLYSTRDLASMKDRVARFHPTKLIYVVDIAQSLHFKQLFATAKKMGLDLDPANPGQDNMAISSSSAAANPAAVDLTHVIFGRMQFPEGSMSTRKGNIILVDQLIKEAEERAQKIIDEKGVEIIPAERKTIAEGIAIGAIKYQIISQNRETNMIFDWDRMLALDGNSAPYLQYAYARAASIIRKAEEKTFVPVNDGPQTNIFEMAREAEIRAAQETENREKNNENSSDTRTETGSAKPSEAESKIYGYPTEQALLRALAKFPEAIEMSARTYKPNLLSNYLYELTQTFNGFYQEVSVLNTLREDLRTSRLDLVHGFTQVLKNGLTILGIQTFERM